LDRSSVALKKWLPLSLVGAAISLITALLLNAPLGKTVVAIALTGVLIFSGFVLRSFGKGKGEGEAEFGNEKDTK
jgi:uncharacterized membrane protein